MNEYNVYNVNAVSQALRGFAATLADALDIVAPVGTLAPYWDELRIVSEWSSQSDVEADLIVGKGVQVTIRAPLTAEGTTAKQLAGQLATVLGDVMEDCRPAQRRLRDIERDARRVMREEKLAGLDARIEAVRFATVHLKRGSDQLQPEIVVEGRACHMLRPYRETYVVAGEDDLDKMFETLRRQLTPRRERLRTARAIGAVGFIDSVALAFIDTLPGGREAILPRIARRFEITEYVDAGVRDPDVVVRAEMVGFRWYDGVVRAYATLSGGSERCWADVTSDAQSPAGCAASLWRRDQTVGSERRSLCRSRPTAARPWPFDPPFVVAPGVRRATDRA